MSARSEGTDSSSVVIPGQASHSSSGSTNARLVTRFMLITYSQWERMKGNAEVATEACLKPDLPNKGGDGHVVWCQCRVYVRKLKTIVGIKNRDGFAVHLLAGVEEGRAQVNSF